ncbi:hypothetical protein [Bradyrhizobium sp. USDA 4506]
MNELTETIMAAGTTAGQGRAWIDRTKNDGRVSKARKRHPGERQLATHSRASDIGAAGVISRTSRREPEGLLDWEAVAGLAQGLSWPHFEAGRTARADAADKH